MIRLFVFDLEGTILSARPCTLPQAPAQHTVGMWPLLMKELGPAASQEDRLLASRWDAGRFPNYLDWCDASLTVMARYGLNRTLFERVMNLFSLNEGVSELVATLHRHGIVTAIISGGFYEQAHRVQAGLKIRHSYAAVDLTWDSEGYLSSWNLFPSGSKGKTGFLRLLTDSYGIDLSECAFVGDGQNDVQIASVAGVSFAYKAERNLVAASTHEIRHFKSVSELLKLASYESS